MCARAGGDGEDTEAGGGGAVSDWNDTSDQNDTSGVEDGDDDWEVSISPAVRAMKHKGQKNVLNRYTGTDVRRRSRRKETQDGSTSTTLQLGSQFGWTNNSSPASLYAFMWQRRKISAIVTNMNEKCNVMY